MHSTGAADLPELESSFADVAQSTRNFANHIRTSQMHHADGFKATAEACDESLREQAELAADMLALVRKNVKEILAEPETAHAVLEVFNFRLKYIKIEGMEDEMTGDAMPAHKVAVWRATPEMVNIALTLLPDLNQTKDAPVIYIQMLSTVKAHPEVNDALAKLPLEASFRDAMQKAVTSGKLSVISLLVPLLQRCFGTSGLAPIGTPKQILSIHNIDNLMDNGWLIFFGRMCSALSIMITESEQVWQAKHPESSSCMPAISSVLRDTSLRALELFILLQDKGKFEERGWPIWLCDMHFKLLVTVMSCKSAMSSLSGSQRMLLLNTMYPYGDTDKSLDVLLNHGKRSFDMLVEVFDSVASVGSDQLIARPDDVAQWYKLCSMIFQVNVADRLNACQYLVDISKMNLRSLVAPILLWARAGMKDSISAEELACINVKERMRALLTSFPPGKMLVAIQGIKDCFRLMSSLYDVPWQTPPYTREDFNETMDAIFNDDVVKNVKEIEPTMLRCMLSRLAHAALTPNPRGPYDRQLSNGVGFRDPGAAEAAAWYRSKYGNNVEKMLAIVKTDFEGRPLCTYSAREPGRSGHHTSSLQKATRPRSASKGGGQAGQAARQRSSDGGSLSSTGASAAAGGRQGGSARPKGHQAAGQTAAGPHVTGQAATAATAPQAGSRTAAAQQAASQTAAALQQPVASKTDTGPAASVGREEHGAKGGQAAGAAAKSMLRTCLACHTTKAGLKKCSRCRAAWFCDEACRDRAWNFHKKECNAKLMDSKEVV